MMLGDVEETVREEVDGKQTETKRSKEMLFVRGDIVILISPTTGI